MGHFGLYEPLVEQVLTEIRPAPWSVEDLRACQALITAEHCLTVYPHCRPKDVVDWLHTLSPADQEELVRHLNAEQAARGGGN